MIDSSFESRVYWKGVRFEGKDKGDSILARMFEDSSSFFFFLFISRLLRGSYDDKSCSTIYGAGKRKYRFIVFGFLYAQASVRYHAIQYSILSDFVSSKRYRRFSSSRKIRKITIDLERASCSSSVYICI